MTNNEWDRWLEQLQAERVTHNNETLPELVRRLDSERFEKPSERLRRKRMEGQPA